MAACILRLGWWSAVGDQSESVETVEVPTTARAVALGHLAAYVEELAVPGERPRHLEKPSTSTCSTDQLTATGQARTRELRRRQDAMSLADCQATSRYWRNAFRMTEEVVS